MEALRTQELIVGKKRFEIVATFGTVVENLVVVVMGVLAIEASCFGGCGSFVGNGCAGVGVFVPAMVVVIVVLVMGEMVLGLLMVGALIVIIMMK